MSNDWPRVEVAWYDIVKEDDTWILPAAVQSPCLCITRGWLIVDGPDYIVVAGTIPGDESHKDQTIGDVNSIPRGCVVKMEREA